MVYLSSEPLSLPKINKFMAGGAKSTETRTVELTPQRLCQSKWQAAATKIPERDFLQKYMKSIEVASSVEKLKFAKNPKGYTWNLS